MELCYELIAGAIIRIDDWGFNSPWNNIDSNKDTLNEKIQVLRDGILFLFGELRADGYKICTLYDYFYKKCGKDESANKIRTICDQVTQLFMKVVEKWHKTFVSHVSESHYLSIVLYLQCVQLPEATLGVGMAPNKLSETMIQQQFNSETLRESVHEKLQKKHDKIVNPKDAIINNSNFTLTTFITEIGKIIGCCCFF